MQTPVHLRKLLLAHHHKNCSIQQRKKVAYFDKSCFLLHHVDGWVCVHWLAWGERMPGCTMGRGQADRGSLMLWAVVCWETLDPAMDVTLTRTTYLNIVADQLHSFIVTLFLNGSGFFQQDNTPCHTTKMVQGRCQDQNDKFKVLTLPPFFPRFQFNWASVECAEQNNQPCNFSDL